jgi:ComF family protein
MIKDFLLNLLFPPKCILCGKLLEKDETDLCRTCRVESPECHKNNLKFSFLDSWAAVWYYDGYIRKSLHRFKFNRARHYADPYGRMLAMKLLNEYPEGFDVLTWVPVSTWRKFTRGYDQVELLAGSVGRELGMEPMRTLRKKRNNRPQSGISGIAKRRANVLGVYQIVDPEPVRGKRVLLLDDIITTGATAGECARVLLTAGAKEVHCGCVAVANKRK